MPYSGFPELGTNSIGEGVSRLANTMNRMSVETSKTLDPHQNYDDAQDVLVETAPITKGAERLPKPKMVDGQSRILWEYLIPVILFHLLIPLAFLPYFFSWWGLLFLPIGNFIFTSLGIGGGYHRLLTHRGFTCPKWLEYTLATLGVCSFQDSPARWVLVHRVHHQHSDHQPDPHTPKVSCFWSHMGWLFIDNRELSSGAAYDKYVRDLMRDPYYLWLQRNAKWALVYAIHAVAITAVGALVGWLWTGTGWGTLQMAAQWMMWGVIMRTIFTWHVTWGINSFAHMWGYRTYDTREDSRNNWLFAILTNGEGWHNNHHADPRSAQHGHRWWEVDPTWWTLLTLEKMGLVKNLVRPNHKSLERKVAA